MYTLISKKDILASVKRGDYNKGLDYARNGRVQLRDVSEDSARAIVRGGRRYVSEFTFVEGSFTGRCSCPRSQNRYVCKHVIATALATLDDHMPRSETASVMRLLREMSRDELVATILDQSVSDQGFFDDLLFASAQAGHDLCDGDLVSVARAGVMSAYRSGDPDAGLARLSAILDRELVKGRYHAVSEASSVAITSIDKMGPIERYGFDEEEDEDFEIDEAHEVVLLLARANLAMGTASADFADRLCRDYHNSGVISERIDTCAKVFGPSFEEEAHEALRQVRREAR